MRGLLSSLLCSCWQNAMRPWHKPIFFAQLQRWGENWQGTAVKWRERRDRETCQKSQRVKSYPARRETGHGTRGRHTPRLCLLCLQCSSCCCCCHFKLPIIDEFAKIQTDRQGRRVRSAVQLKRLTASSARRSCPEIARLLASLPACLSCPALCQLGFWAGHQRLHVRVRATHAPGLDPSRIMQIKWHISMSVAILLLQFSSLPSEAINWKVERKGKGEGAAFA